MLGVLSLGLWWVLFTLVSVMLQSLRIELDVGLYIGLAELVLLVPVWWFAVRKYSVGWRKLGLRDFRSRALGIGCGLMILASLFNVFYSAILSLFGLQTQTDLAPVFAGLSSPWWLLLAGIVVAPIVEEIFFRGFVFAGLLKRYNWKKAALISSTLFALIHLQPTAMLPIFILGFIFAYLYHRSHSIWPAIIMHVSTNALALGTAYLISQTGLRF